MVISTSSPIALSSTLPFAQHQPSTADLTKRHQTPCGHRQTQPVTLAILQPQSGVHSDRLVEGLIPPKLRFINLLKLHFGFLEHRDLLLALRRDRYRHG